ncbi:TonB C-terminal domain-containing protein [Sphingomonas sp. QA11]|uniref:secretin and TonB N-terminal domain-containing protein n=1 Tax=Sphingomonas sp. QA11 TaxID=2950605 RepID=UPI00234A28B6|nr:secretin and TonB N-terminal domain-containing protein [Sphingomonas sp. QA11]WCM28016.1 TonB C-terminal domain-containing protein [Sphingomonas sp. QA11]
MVAGLMLQRKNSYRSGLGRFPEPAGERHGKETWRNGARLSLAARKAGRLSLSSQEMFVFRSTRSFLVSLIAPVASMVVPISNAALSQQTAADQKIAFDIPAQPLDSALAQYFQASGVQLLYDSSLTQSRRSAPVRGRYAPREALRRLLTETGLIVRYSRANAAIITTSSATSSEGPLIPLGRVVVRERIGTAMLSPAERLAYYNQLETELQTYLRGDRRTGRLVFGILVELRVNDDGKLSDVRLDRGSGNRRVDLTVIDTLRSAIVSPPPDRLDQPLRIALKGVRR